MFRKLCVTVVALGAVAVAAPAAQASDASLRAAIERHDPGIVAPTKAWESAIKHLDSQAGITKAKKATTRLKAKVDSYKTAVSREHASSLRYKRGRVAMLKGLTSLHAGLVQFRRGLIALASGDQATAQKTIKSSVKRFNTAEKQLKKAVREFN
jgi:uncharacterized phage infection (PIP) family protein YhgE